MKTGYITWRKKWNYQIKKKIRTFEEKEIFIYV